MLSVVPCGQVDKSVIAVVHDDGMDPSAKPASGRFLSVKPVSFGDLSTKLST